MDPNNSAIKRLCCILIFIFYDIISANTHTTVKRHHSAGDMLDDAQYGSTGRNTSRPRSEGHKYLSAFANKRASSYAVS